MDDKLREAAQMAYAVPLHELIATVPRDARLVIEDANGKGTRFIPVGRYCHEAAEALRAALATEQEQQEDDLSEIANLLPNCAVVKLDNKTFFVQPKTKESKQQFETRRKQIDGYFAVSQKVLAQPEPEELAQLEQAMIEAWKPIPQRDDAPAKAVEWQGLTDEEQMQVAWSCGAMSADWLDFARAIEAKLREKNNGGQQ